MESFVHCVLFEPVGCCRTGGAAHAIYSTSVVGIPFLVLCAAASLVMLQMVSGPRLSWAGAVSAAMPILNVGVVAAVTQEGTIPRLGLQRHRQRLEPSDPETEQSMCSPIDSRSDT
jgi:hypothetical protein